MSSKELKRLGVLARVEKEDLNLVNPLFSQRV
jgi:hypothetical protein